jgi:hypothetical protein
MFYHVVLPRGKKSFIALVLSQLEAQGARLLLPNAVAFSVPMVT